MAAAASSSSSSPVVKVEALGFPFKTPNPFLFCAYHLDQYPAGNERMEAPRAGDGADFNPSAPYRMYHGDRIPGFPQHPHRGFETLTAVVTGVIDHTDSMGNSGRYGHGDLQWMTAGSGVVHGEMFPLVNRDAPNPLKLFQIWLNLPKAKKMTPPAFAMHWAESIPKVEGRGGAVATVWAGSLGGANGLPPPPASWAVDADNEVGVWLLTLPPGGEFDLPAARHGAAINRAAYVITGKTLDVGGTALGPDTMATLRAAVPSTVRNTHATQPAEVLILQGRPIDEPVAQHGPFVMNTSAEIAQAFADYRRTQFGGWPWPQDAMAFPRDQPRFASRKGPAGPVVEHPPTPQAAAGHGEL